jgi:hypothetical protein
MARTGGRPNQASRILSDAVSQEIIRMQRNHSAAARVFRVFLSSPADVQPEREAAERVVRRLGGIYAEHVDLRLERWEPKFYEATRSFQEQIESTAEFDLVIAIFWKDSGRCYPAPGTTRARHRHHRARRRCSQN